MHGDRAVSWLPYYHDMGFVGFVLAPMAAQVSVDYMSPTEFAKRPLQWLTLISASRATIAFSPTFGYELCSRRLRREDIERLDLSSWRVAGVGAEMIRPDALEQFADQFAPAGFDRRAFMACYGMAECSLAVSFSPLDTGLRVDRVDRRRLAESRIALPVDDTPGDAEVGRFVNCGRALPGFEVEVRDDGGRVLPARRCGTVFVRGPSVSPGYFADPAATEEVLSPEGWLDTGDLGLPPRRQPRHHRAPQRSLDHQRPKHLAARISSTSPRSRREVSDRAAAAFSVPGPGGEEMAAMVVQCRVTDPARRAALVERLQTAILEEIGIRCLIELVPPHTLPRTSSGKLSRAGARERIPQAPRGRGAGRSMVPTVALTGATGFIGRTLVRRLESAGLKVRALVRSTSDVTLLPAGVERVVGALDDAESLRRLVRGARAVVHCAGAVRGASARDFDPVNVDGVARLAHAIARRATGAVHRPPLVAGRPPSRAIPLRGEQARRRAGAPRRARLDRAAASGRLRPR